MALVRLRSLGVQGLLEILVGAVLHLACSETKCLEVFRLLQRCTAWGNSRWVGGLRHQRYCHLCPWHNWHVHLCPRSILFAPQPSFLSRKFPSVLHKMFHCHVSASCVIFPHAVYTSYRACDARCTPVFGSPLNTHFGLVGGPWCFAALRYSLAMGSNFFLRGAKEGSRPALRDPTVTLSLVLLHSFTVDLRKAFRIQASDQSLSRLLFVLCSCNFVKRRMSFARVSFSTVRFKTLSCTLPSSQLRWRLSARRWVLRMARNPWVRQFTPAFEDLVVKFGTETTTLALSGRQRRLCDAVRFLKELVLQPAPASRPNTTVSSSPHRRHMLRPTTRPVHSYLANIPRGQAFVRPSPSPTTKKHADLPTCVL